MTLAQPSTFSRFVVATIATILGGYVVYDAGKDFEFVKFEPHSPEEVERRKREKIGISMKQLETSTLDYTPEAKERLRRLMEEKRAKDSQQSPPESDTK